MVCLLWSLFVSIEIKYIFSYLLSNAGVIAPVSSQEQKLMDVELHYMCMKMQYDVLRKQHTSDGKRLQNMKKILKKIDKDISHLNGTMQ